MWQIPAGCLLLLASCAPPGDAADGAPLPQPPIVVEQQIPAPSPGGVMTTPRRIDMPDF